MTIAIAAAGPNAGRAIYEGLKAAEKIGTQSIGGFVTFAALTKDGTIVRSETQRGGSSTLFVDGERNGVDPPSLMAETVAAALISSGPDRPMPLSQFVAADVKGGLITGHRIPTALSVNGKPINREALEHLLAGRTAEETVDIMAGENPESDFGLIAIDLAGRVYARNSARVQRRSDVHQAEMTLDGAAGKAIALQNSIQPYKIVAEVAVAVAHHIMRGPVVAEEWITVEPGLPVRLARESAIHCDANLRAKFVTTTDASILKGTQVASTLYLNSPVFRDGKLVGCTVGELLGLFNDGQIISFSGQERARLGFVRR